MANYTTNLSLKKPVDADGFDIQDFNGNADKIDAAFGANFGQNGAASVSQAIGKNEAGLAIIVDGDSCTTAVPAGGYAYIKNNTHGLAEGLYRNKSGSAFPTSGGTANSTIFEAVSNGGLNALNSKIEKNNVTVTSADNDISTFYKRPCFLQNNTVYATIQFRNTGSEKTGSVNLFTMQYNSSGTAVGIGVCADGTAFIVAINDGSNVLKLDDGKIKTGWGVIHIVYLVE